MFIYEIIIGVLFMSISFINSKPKDIPTGTLNKAYYYLKKYGYLRENYLQSSITSSEKKIKGAVETFQRFAGLNPTGVIDIKTIQMMKKPRCSLPDIVQTGNITRIKRYSLEGSKWPKKSLSYRIKKYTKDLTRKIVDIEFRKSFKAWSDVSELKFLEKKNGPVDIEISFERLEHGDESPFDGLGCDLAHAFYPQFGGDAHFDDDELWTTNSRKGSNLFQVAVHELGHSLGLLHSNNVDAIMAPFFEAYNASARLHCDDIKAIQALYGAKKNYCKNFTAQSDG